jgi:hypothetical protein
VFPTLPLDKPALSPLTNNAPYRLLKMA